MYGEMQAALVDLLLLAKGGAFAEKFTAKMDRIACALLSARKCGLPPYAICNAGLTVLQRPAGQGGRRQHQGPVAPLALPRGRGGGGRVVAACCTGHWALVDPESFRLVRATRGNTGGWVWGVLVLLSTKHAAHVRSHASCWI